MRQDREYNIQYLLASLDITVESDHLLIREMQLKARDSWGVLVHVELQKPPTRW